MATSTKTRKQASAKPKSTRKPKTTAKPKQAKRASAKPKQTPAVGRSKQTPRDQSAAAKATVQMRENARGDGKRAPVNATQVAMVRALVGRRSVATVAKSLKFASKAQLVRHARGQLDQMPDGASAALVEFAAKLDGPGSSKVRGRKLTAIIANL